MTTVWLMNHYATNHYSQRGGRHYWLATKLQERGYEVHVFAASTIHGNPKAPHFRGTKHLNGVTYHFLRTPRYTTKLGRVFNVLVFYLALLILPFRRYPKPDVLYASSVHPLTLLGGLQLARFYKRPCVCEVRDLWPLSIEVFESRIHNTLLAKFLYRGEKYLYCRADRLIFTMPGGADYIKQQGWANAVPLAKIHHISNGVDLNTFDALAGTATPQSKELTEDRRFTVVYTGSIRKVNNVEAIVRAAEVLHKENRNDIAFYMFGDGDQRRELEHLTEPLPNISFKGAVPKQDVPSILRAADALVFHGDQGKLAEYGTSMNKLFEYLASGTPIISDCLYGYDPVETSGSGIVAPNATPEELAQAVIQIASAPDDTYQKMARSARRASLEYDFEALADKLEDAIAITRER